MNYVRAAIFIVCANALNVAASAVCYHGTACTVLDGAYSAHPPALCQASRCAQDGAGLGLERFCVFLSSLRADSVERMFDNVTMRECLTEFLQYERASIDLIADFNAQSIEPQCFRNATLTLCVCADDECNREAPKSTAPIKARSSAGQTHVGSLCFAVATIVFAGVLAI